MALPYCRYLNMIYSHVVENLHPDYDKNGKVTKSAEDKKKVFDRWLWDGAHPNESEQSDAPHWWKGDEDAAQSGLAAARALGINVRVP